MTGVEPILVTGAAGFIGFHVARRLLERGRSVVGIDNFDPYYDVRLKEARLKQLAVFPTFGCERLDIADRESMAALFSARRFPQIVHLAAQAGVPVIKLHEGGRHTGNSLMRLRFMATSLLSLRSWLNSENPRRSPAGSRSAVIVTLARNWDPSLRTRIPCSSWRPLSAVIRRTSSGRPCAMSSGGKKREKFLPMISSAA